MGELRLNTIRLNTVSLNTMPINSIGFKKKASSPSSGDVDENGYIIFADPEVKRVLLANGVGDGVGITKEDAAATTSIGTWFVGNTTLNSFNELGLFGGDEGVNVSFRDCTNLESVDLSNVVGGTEGGAFSGLDSLHIDIDMSRLKTFPYAGFRKSAITGVKNLGLITSIPAAYAYIENGAFYECTELKYANIPEVITTLPMALFAGCSALSEIHLAWEKIGKIEGNAFNGCTSLEIEDLLLPNLVSLGSTAFTNVKIKKISNLGHLTSLPNSWNGAFGYGDPSVLEEVVLPDAITEIPGNSFSYYTSLHNINLPKTITSIGKAAFSGSAINIELDLPNLITLGSQSFRTTGITKIINLGSITRLEDESSGWATFSLCKNLTSVVLPDTLEYIGNNSFNGCSSLESVYFGGTKTIGAGAFGGSIKSLRDIRIDNIVSIGNSAFYGSGLVNVYLGENLTSIGAQAFEANANLECFVCAASTPPTIQSNTFNSTNSTFIIYVPDASVEAYKTATNWNTYADRILPLSQYNG